MNAILATVEPPASGVVAREAGALETSLRSFGHRVATIVPHNGLPGPGEKPQGAEEVATFEWEGERFAMSKTRRRGTTDLIHLWHSEFAETATFYRVEGFSGAQAVRRCALFCRGVVEIVRRLRPSPQVILPLDWPTALIAALIKQELLPLCAAVPVVDSRYHGLTEAAFFDLLGLDKSWFTPGTGEFFGRFSFLKAGLVASDRILVRGGRVLHDLQNNPAEPLAGVFRAQAHKVRLFAPSFSLSTTGLSSRVKSATVELPAAWRRGGVRQKLPLLCFWAIDGACLSEIIRAARLLAYLGWNILLHATKDLLEDAALIELDQPELGVTLTPLGLSDEDLFALCDVVFFCSEQCRDASALASCAAHGALPVPIRRPHLTEALDLALNPETLDKGDPPRFTFDHATETALIDAGRALLPFFKAGRGQRGKSIASAAARSFDLAKARFGDPLDLLWSAHANENPPRF